MKNGIDYFPLNTNFFDDDKIALLEAEFGPKGSYLCLRLLCKIYDGEGYYCEWGEDECLLFARKVGGGLSPGLVQQVVNKLLQRAFFDKGKYECYGILTSKAIQRRFLFVAKRRVSSVMKHEYILIHDEVRKYPNVKVVYEDGREQQDTADALLPRSVSGHASQAHSASEPYAADPVEYTPEEKREYVEIFFWKNMRNPEHESDRFISRNELHEWRTKDGIRLDTKKKRFAAANAWKPEDQSPRLSVPFLETWRKAYEMMNKKSPSEARLMINSKVSLRCSTSQVIITVPRGLDVALKHSPDIMQVLTSFCRRAPVFETI